MDGAHERVTAEARDRNRDLVGVAGFDDRACRGLQWPHEDEVVRPARVVPEPDPEGARETDGGIRWFEPFSLARWYGLVPRGGVPIGAPAPAPSATIVSFTITCLAPP